VLGATPGGAAPPKVLFRLVVPGGPRIAVQLGIESPQPLAGRGGYFIRQRKRRTNVTLAFGNSSELVFALQAPGQPSGFMMFLPLILIMVIFYFLMILPAQRRQKKATDMLKALKNGDKVITNGGIYGTIVGLDESDDTVQLRIAEQVKMKVARNAIAGMQQQEPPKENS
jgi:preprotein translocase subunit YajC